MTDHKSVFFNFQLLQLSQLWLHSHETYIGESADERISEIGCHADKFHSKHGSTPIVKLSGKSLLYMRSRDR